MNVEIFGTHKHVFPDTHKSVFPTSSLGFFLCISSTISNDMPLRFMTIGVLSTAMMGGVEADRPGFHGPLKT